LTIGVVGRDYQTVDAATVKRMNELVVACCDRFLYSKTKIQEITDMVDNFGGWSVPGTTAFVGQMPGPENIEEFLRQKLGIKRRAAAASTGKDLGKNSESQDHS
jgi:hypothetical protein